MAMASVLGTQLLCEPGFVVVVDMDEGGYMIIEKYFKTTADNPNHLSPSWARTTRAERNMLSNSGKRVFTAI